MAFFEVMFGIALKEILEMAIATASLALFYVSYKTFADLRIQRSKYADSFKIISFGFMFFFFSMLFELVDSFYFKYVFDKLQLLTGIIAFILFFIGFKNSFGLLKRGKANA